MLLTQRTVLSFNTPEAVGAPRAHQDLVGKQVRVLQRLETRLGRTLDLPGDGREIDAEEFLKTMEVRTMFGKYYTPDQLDALDARGEALGEKAIQAAQSEWPQLIARVKEEMAKGTDPGSPQVQELATRWRELIQAFSGGDTTIEVSLGRMYRDEPDLARRQGLDPELFEYLGRAFEAGP